MPNGNLEWQQLERALREVVVRMRGIEPQRNIVLHVPETGDFVAVLPLDEVEARALEAMLHQR